MVTNYKDFYILCQKKLEKLYSDIPSPIPPLHKFFAGKIFDINEKLISKNKINNSYYFDWIKFIQTPGKNSIITKKSNKLQNYKIQYLVSYDKADTIQRWIKNPEAPVRCITFISMCVALKFSPDEVSDLLKKFYDFQFYPKYLTHVLFIAAVKNFIKFEDVMAVQQKNEQKDKNHINNADMRTGKFEKIIGDIYRSYNNSSDKKEKDIANNYNSSTTTIMRNTVWELQSWSEFENFIENYKNIYISSQSYIINLIYSMLEEKYDIIVNMPQFDERSGRINSSRKIVPSVFKYYYWESELDYFYTHIIDKGILTIKWILKFCVRCKFDSNQTIQLLKYFNRTQKDSSCLKIIFEYYRDISINESNISEYWKNFEILRNRLSRSDEKYAEIFGFLPDNVIKNRSLTDKKNFLILFIERIRRESKKENNVINFNKLPFIDIERLFFNFYANFNPDISAGQKIQIDKKVFYTVSESEKNIVKKYCETYIKENLPTFRRQLLYLCAAVIYTVFTGLFFCIGTYNKKYLERALSEWSGQEDLIKSVDDILNRPNEQLGNKNFQSLTMEIKLISKRNKK